jgi:hypothetical protein
MPNKGPKLQKELESFNNFNLDENVQALKIEASQLKTDYTKELKLDTQ